MRLAYFNNLSYRASKREKQKLRKYIQINWFLFRYWKTIEIHKTPTTLHIYYVHKTFYHPLKISVHEQQSRKRSKQFTTRTILYTRAHTHECTYINIIYHILSCCYVAAVFSQYFFSSLNFHFRLQLFKHLKIKN